MDYSWDFMTGLQWIIPRIQISCFKTLGIFPCHCHLLHIPGRAIPGRGGICWESTKWHLQSCAGHWHWENPAFLSSRRNQTPHGSFVVALINSQLIKEQVYISYSSVSNQLTGKKSQTSKSPLRKTGVVRPPCVYFGAFYKQGWNILGELLQCCCFLGCGKFRSIQSLPQSSPNCEFRGRSSLGSRPKRESKKVLV